MTLPDMELVAAKVHEGWMAAKISAGVASRKLDTTGEELMVPYAELSEEAKELDRGTVRTIYAVVEDLIAAGAPEIHQPLVDEPAAPVNDLQCETGVSATV